VSSEPNQFRQEFKSQASFSNKKLRHNYHKKSAAENFSSTDSTAEDHQLGNNGSKGGIPVVSAMNLLD
jgi:hypothetical protein